MTRSAFLLNSSPVTGILSIFSRLRLLALAFLLALLELPEPACPRVPPLDNQAAFVCHHSALPGGVLVVPQQQVLLPGLDLGTLAGQVFGADPQELVPAADAALALLVDRDDVDGELPPLAGLFCLQDVHLDSCGVKLGSRRDGTWMNLSSKGYFLNKTRSLQPCQWLREPVICRTKSQWITQVKFQIFMLNTFYFNFIWIIRKMWQDNFLLPREQM